MLESDHESAPRRTRSADAGVCATTSSNSEGRAQRLGMSAFDDDAGDRPGLCVDLRSTVDDFRQFLHSESVGAYLGLTPRRYQSGEIDRVGWITQVGDGAHRPV